MIVGLERLDQLLFGVLGVFFYGALKHDVSFESWLVKGAKIVKGNQHIQVWSHAFPFT